MRKLFDILILLLLASPAWSATIYVGSGETYTTIPAGIAAMSAGDTLIVRDGTYSTAISAFPTGTSGSWCTIQAENDGGAIITGAFHIDSGQYTNFVGFKVSSAVNKYIYAPYVKVYRCAFQGGATCSSNCAGAVNFDLYHYQLLEDCWFYGTGGRYSVGAIDSDGAYCYNVVLRRCVIRHDGGYTANEGNPESAMVVYGGRNISLQNVIIIDSYSSNGSDPYDADFYITNHAGYPEPVGNNYLGCMVVNGIVGAIFCDYERGSTDPLEIENFLVLGGEDGLVVWPNGAAAYTFAVNGATVYGLNTTSGAVASGGNGAMTIINSAFWNHDSVASGPSVTYTNAYNPASFTGTGVTHVDPSASMLYGVRIEDGSTLKTSGSGGGQMGAQIVKRIGVSGTLYGEADYNATTEDDLWPWPNEDRIKTDMAAVSNRGFTAYSGMDGEHNTLTSYIWEYMGNQIPSTVYGSSPPESTASNISGNFSMGSQ
jgi:hypothetical protein